MGLGALLANIAAKVVENGGKFLLHGLDGFVDMGAYNVNSRVMTMDDPPTAQEINNEQLAISAGHLSVAQIVQNYQSYLLLRRAVQMPFLVNLQPTEVKLTLNMSFYYGKESGWKTIGSESNGMKVRVIGIKDHAYCHLIPTDFPSYNQLAQHDFFIFNSANVKSTQDTGLNTSTFVGFLPYSRNTNELSNEQLKTLLNHSDAKADNTIDFTVRAASGNNYFFEYDSKEKNYTKLIKDTNTMNPDLVYVPEIIDQNLKEQGNEQVLSFGTFVFVKNNFGDAEVACSFTIEMNFTAYDMFSQAIVSSGSDSGSSNTGSTRAFTYINKGDDLVVPKKKRSLK